MSLSSDPSEPRLTVGASLLGLVTIGISGDPLVMYREYIQNSVDALAKSTYSDGGRIDILIDRQRRQVRVKDNGPGLSFSECIEHLLPIGRSQKVAGVHRGFRGIGRLSALAFANSVRFLTRTKDAEPVTCVSWSGSSFREWSSKTAFHDEIVQESVTVERVCGSNYPDHFFEVQVDGIERHAAGLVLNRDAVKAYIAEVCPVAMPESFTFADDVWQLFGSNNAPYSQEIFIGDDVESVKRQYGPDLPLSDSRRDDFVDLEPVRIPSMDGRGEAAVGWIAHSSYLGAIPKPSGVRGMRARVGNIQIGDERVFDHLFAEERFNRWCVGEIHVIDSKVVPNARRDYFEPGPHLRHLENHLSSVARGITLRCRSASRVRNQTRRIQKWRAR